MRDFIEPFLQLAIIFQDPQSLNRSERETKSERERKSYTGIH